MSDTAVQRLETIPSCPVAQPIPTNPSEMLYLAMSQGKGMDELQKFMDLKDRWEAAEARKAFVSAMSRFKSNDIAVSKDKANVQYGSRYTSLGNLINTATPYLSQNGLSASWDLDQSGPKIKVTCIITHSMGHSESVSMEAPPDTSGAKNVIQQIKSTVTYLKASTFESICGLASTDANLDDDGNGYHQKAPVKDATGADVPPVDLEKAQAAINAATTIPALVKAFNEYYAIAQKGKDRPAMEQLMAAQNKRQAEIKKGGSK